MPAGTYLEQGKYYIERVLGDGGFGITYLGYDVKLQRKVAIKEFYLRGYCYRNPGDPNIYPYGGREGEIFQKMKQQYIQEGQVLAVLGEQPGVVNVYTFIEENNTAYLVMDFVEGQSLGDYLEERGGVLSVSQALAIMRPVIRALGGVHRRGVVHRDISPDNIMITHDRKVKLIDFGAAKQYGDYNADKVQKGGYSPIEQVTAQGQVGPYSDIYALCATMYYCITGRKVVPARERVLQDTLVPPSAYGVAITQQTESVLMWGLALYPENRIQNAESLYQYLYDTQEQQPQQQGGYAGTVTQEFANSAVTQMLSDMQKEQKRHYKKSTIITIICTIVFILAGAGMYFISVGKKEKQKDAETTSQQAESAAEGLDTEDCEAYAQEFFDLCMEKHEQQGKTLSKLSEFSQAAEYAAKEGSELFYTNSDELNAGLSEIGNRAISNYKIPNTGWVMYTFASKEAVEDVKRTLDSYILQINTENQGMINLDNCEYLGVSVARSKDGVYFWAVFYR